MKLSDLSPDEVQPVSAPQSGGLKLSGLSESDVSPAAPSQPQGFLEKTGRQVVNSLPLVGGVAGGILGTPADLVAGPMGNVAGAAAGGYLGTATKNLINSYIDPQNAPQTMGQAITDPIKGGISQAGMQAGGELLGAAASPLLSKMTQPVADYLKALAEKKAVAATGATGAQAAKFAPDAGRQLLDRGIVGFGDSQAQIANKAADALDASGKGISDTLGQLDQQGVSVDRQTVLDYLKQKIAALSDNEGEKPLVNQLQQKVADIEEQIPGSSADIDAENAAEATPSSQIPIGKSEEIKRSFDAAGKWNGNSDAASLEANRITGNAYRQASEDAATAANPDLASKFQENKDSFHLLKDIAAASEKRASTLNQSPHGGLLDTAASGVGALVGGTPGAVVAPIARRALSSRLASSEAAGADWLGNLVKSSPSSLGKWAPALTAAASRGGTALGATDYLLQQTDPDYRMHLSNLKGAQEEALNQ